MSIPLKDLKASAMEPTVVKAHLVHLRLLLISWTTHFRSVGYMKDELMDTMDRDVAQKTLELSATNYKIREAIGMSPQVWKDIIEVFHIATRSLEQRSFGPLPHISPIYDGPRSNTIVDNAFTLLKDLHRLDLLLQVARNSVTFGEKAQNQAAQLGIDREICSLISLCIKITARGYDGDGTRADEQKWQGVINGFKKLLITSLQFLSNLTTQNEPLKLMLWTELFDGSAGNANSESSSSSGLSQDEEVETLPRGSKKNGKRPMAVSEDIDPPMSTSKKQLPSDLPTMAGQPGSSSSPEAILANVVQRAPQGNKKMKSSAEKIPSNKPPKDTVQEMWEALPEHKKEAWRQAYVESKFHPDSDTDPWVAATNLKAAETFDPDGSYRRSLKSEAAQDSEIETFEPPKPEEEMDPLQKIISMQSAQEGHRKLHEGKTQLLKRLQNAPSEGDPSVMVSANSSLLSPQSPQSSPLLEEDEEDESADMESSEEDFALPGEDGRGLLTDVPLILGPNEIEVLPMIIMNGLVKDDSAQKPPTSNDQPPVNLHTIRAHLLLAQDNGRNLLRELLIFVAAWDLREEELYFKFMVKIVEAILKHGLMPFAYSAFKENKDIISPAQAVLMKLLTKIFHSRNGFVEPAKPEDQFSDATPQSKSADSSTPIRPDVQIVQHLFAEFRSHIIPQICALIFLQGQIRQGNAQLEVFPLNLWDMERMYEGVYQYLEFFAILTDHGLWKDKFAEWEVTSELITLLRELEIAIPKRKSTSDTQPGKSRNQSSDAGATSSGQQQNPTHQPGVPSSQSPSNVSSSQPPKAVSVERPYDTNDTAGDGTVTNPAQAADTSDPKDPGHDPLHDEPADFEWRNLKKLCVLVLSSLVWKNKRLQDQVREFGGVLVVLSCCAHDEHNPYIREHAIMCLRFLLEGNKENAEEVQALSEGVAGQTVQWAAAITAASGGEQGDGENGESASLTPVKVPVEVLDQHGYESFIDEKGQVGLRKKVAPAPPSPEELEEQLATDMANVNLGKGDQAEGASVAGAKESAESSGHASTGAAGGDGVFNGEPSSSKPKGGSSKPPPPAEKPKPQQKPQQKPAEGKKRGSNKGKKGKK